MEQRVLGSFICLQFEYGTALEGLPVNFTKYAKMAYQQSPVILIHILE